MSPDSPVTVNVTEPVGTPVDGLFGATWATKLTGAPVTTGGVVGDVKVVVVGALCTTFESVPVLPTNVESAGVYVAVTV
jgi:hypothetical protein